MKWGLRWGLEGMDVTCERSLERHVWIHSVQWRDEAQFFFDLLVVIVVRSVTFPLMLSSLCCFA